MPLVSFTKQARKDLLDIWLYLAPRAGEAVSDRIYDEIEELCRSLGVHPELGRVRPEIFQGARSFIVERCLILYRLNNKSVQIVRIIDGARDISRIMKGP